MQVQVSETGKLSRQIDVTIPAEQVSNAFTARFENISKTAKVDGFRAGKVPMSEIKKRFGDKVQQEVFQSLLQANVPMAIAESKVEPAGQPRLKEQSDLAEGQEFKFSLECDVFPEIKPKGFDKLKLEKHVAAPTDEMVQESIQRLLDQAQQYEAKEGKDAKATNGDQVTIDAVGYLDGEKEAFEGGRLADFKLVLGSNSMIDGFEKAIEGKAAGEEFEIKTQFPKDYMAKEVAGKKARFETTLKAVAAPKFAEATDEWAAQFQVKDLAELTAKIKERLELDLEQASEQRLKREMFDALDKANSFDVPEGLVESEFNAIWKQHMEDMQRRGVPIEAIGSSIDEQRVEFRELAGRRVRLGLLLTEIGKAKEVKVENDEINAEIERIAAQAGPQADQVRQYYAQPEQRKILVGPLYENKVVAALLDGATTTEKKADAKELLKELG